MSVRGQYIVDSCGRVRIFHGINAVQKGFPWYPVFPNPPLLDPSYMKNLSDWGFNVIRLGIMWAGTEPQEGVYNETYLSIMKTIVESAQNNGIYVILDMHQDVLSSQLAEYDGIPLWLYNKFPACVPDTCSILHLPTVSTCYNYSCPFSAGTVSGTNWALGYLTSECSYKFQQLYHNNNGAVVSWSMFWNKIARTFGSYSNVLGYELINEPWAGDVYKNPALLLPGVTGRLNLLPVYDKLNEAIRADDTESLLFYQPVTWGVVLNEVVAGTGFTRVPGGDQYRNLSVLAYHWYCFTISIDPANPTFAKTTCGVLGDSVFQSIRSDVKRTGGSSFLTEFGFDPTSPVDNQDNMFVLEKSDQYFQSWTVWGIDFLDGTGNVEDDIVLKFSRPYARAIAGKPISMFYDQDNTKCFTLTYILKASIQCHTEIYLPPMVYDSNKVVTLSSQLQWMPNSGDANVIDVYNISTLPIGEFATIK
ncbi:unnamed protein product, partial [Didymodactylos carnosus]